MKGLCNGFLWSAVLGTLLLQISPAEAQEKTVYKFCSLASCYDGDRPSASLINVNGTLYGTTVNGGTKYYGTAFTFDPATGTETVLHSFCSQQNCTDGQNPYASLVEANGTLYGTTYAGGASGRGTMFSLDPNTGAETVLYSFCSNTNCKDGANPRAGLIDMHGKLYGTAGGGRPGYGVVFLIDPPTGREKVIYSFCSQKNCTDGAFPRAGLVDMNGTLFGTTYQGGNYGKGTLFSLDPKSGVETALHSFGSGSDGQNPMADLIDANGMLYGTTIAGGADGKGTVFSLDPESGAEATLHSFGNGSDGQNPVADVINVHGALYGTTKLGGTYGSGTVFSLDPSTGTEKVLYSFCSQPRCRDGTKPVAGLLKLKGRLYGTTFSGGRRLQLGVIFWVKR